MATITRRGKSFRFRAYAGYDLAGRQIEKSMTWTPPKELSDKQAEKEARRQAALFEERIRTGQVANGKIKFADFAQLWFHRYADQQLRPRTVARYRELMDRINPALGHLPMERITPTCILEFYQTLKNSEPINATYFCTVDLKALLKANKLTQTALSQKTGVALSTIRNAWHGRPIAKKSAEKIQSCLNAPFVNCWQPANPNKAISSNTVQHYHRLVRKILADAVSWQYILYNPCDRIASPKADHPDPSYLDDKEAKQLVTLLTQQSGIYRRAVLLLLLTGMRRGELLGLEWSDINWVCKTVQIVRTSQYLPKQGVFTDTTKNKSSHRVIYVSDSTIDLLRAQYLWQQRQRKQLGDAWVDSDRVITSEDGSPMHPDRLTRWFGKFIKRSNLPPIHLHSLRHTYASLCIANGVPITAVSAQLGHANVATTASIYAHAIKSAQIAAADKVGGLFEDVLKIK